MIRRRVLLAGSLLAIPLVGIAIAASVEPVTIRNWSPAGGAYGECAAIGCDADYAFKVDPFASGEYYDEDSGNTFTIVVNADGSFNWASEYPVCAVIVKGGPAANIYWYDGAYSDTQLFAPINLNNNKPYGVSHVTFCFNEPEVCYKAETAWADGDRYNPGGQGNWATYVAYDGDEKTVVIYAGQTIDVGTATFSAPYVDADGDLVVDISIVLSGAVFGTADAEGNLVDKDENIKVQDYADPPSGNPAPGGFASKATATTGSTSYTITVPANNYYGVHLDVAVPCD